VASPQKENGYTPTAHELLQAIALARLRPAERAVIDCIARHTYGWNRKSAQISRRQFADWTHYSERQVGRALGELEAANMIWADRTTRPTTWGIQKDYDLWARMADKLGHQMSTLDGHQDVHHQRKESKKKLKKVLKHLLAWRLPREAHERKPKVPKR